MKKQTNKLKTFACTAVCVVGALVFGTGCMSTTYTDQYGNTSTKKVVDPYAASAVLHGVGAAAAGVGVLLDGAHHHHHGYWGPVMAPRPVYVVPSVRYYGY